MGSYYLDWLPQVVGAALDPLGFPWEPFDEYWLHRSRSSGGYDQAPYCVMFHHTAGNGDAWSDAEYQCYTAAARPVSNITIDENVCLILAGGATNTNGSGSNSPMAFSRGVVPEDDMNRYAVGIEICNNGVGEAYQGRMMDALFALSNGINARCGNRPSDVCTHQHYAPERKVDPAVAAAVMGDWQPGACNNSGSWDVHDLQTECERRALEALEDDDMPLSNEDIDKIADAVWAKVIDTTPKGAEIEPQPARYWLQRTYLIVREYLGGFPGRPPDDPTMLKEIHSEVTRGS